MGVLLKNNATSRLASSLTAGATTLSVVSGEGAKFPSPTAGQWFPLTVIKASGVLEIMRCTARSGDVLTVVRAQEGTGAQAFTAGDRVELRITAGALAEFKQTDTISAFMQGMLDDANAEEARTTLGLGTAALLTATTSSDDNTAGRAVRMGDRGIGRIGARYLGDMNDLRNTQVRAIGHRSQGVTNSPPQLAESSSAGICVVYAWENENLGFVQQLFMQVSVGSRVFHRLLVDGVSGNWVELYHTDNIATASVAEAAKLKTSRKINNVNFDGSSDITITAEATAASVLSAVAGAALGSVGTYAFMRSDGITEPGVTVAGSSLQYSSATGTSSTVAVSGTWRCMGRTSGDSQRSLFLRIS